jgi:hypothetical protein
MDISLLLGVLKEGLRLWNDRQSTKYLDRVISLEKKYYEELSKPSDERSDLELDRCLLEFKIISQSFVQYPGKKRAE